MSLPYRIWFVQLAIALTVVSAMVFVGHGQAWAASIASLVILIPNGIFAWFATSDRSHADTAEQVLQAQEAMALARQILFQQVVKLLLTVTLMALALVLCDPEPLGFFCALIAIQAGYLAAPALGGK